MCGPVDQHPEQWSHCNRKTVGSSTYSNFMGDKLLINFGTSLRSKRFRASSSRNFPQ